MGFSICFSVCLLVRLSQKQTSSSALAKSPRDASCLLVVSFNSTKRRVESFIVSSVGYIQFYHCVQLNVLFCCLWRNVEASCHKHFVVFSRNQHRRLLPAMCHIIGRFGPIKLKMAEIRNRHDVIFLPWAVRFG